MADGTMTAMVAMSITKEGRTLGEMLFEDGTEVTMVGDIETMTETAEGVVFQVAAEWTDAAVATFIVTDEALDYEVISELEITTGRLPRNTR